MTLYGVDLSSWKPVKDIDAVKAAGNEFLITKCTGGLTYANPLYADQIGKARSAGMLVGHFHYLHEASLNPASTQAGYRTPERMKAEADWFLANVDIQPGEIVALDVEDPDVTGNLSNCVLVWCEYVATKLGFLPFIYTYPYYIKERNLTNPELTDYPLWYAEYNEPMVNSPAPWGHVTLRQYTATAWVSGISTPGQPGDVDRNTFEGTHDDWRALGKPGDTPTNPSPIITPETNWGEGSKGRVVHRAETILVINDEGKTYIGVRIDGNQLPWQEVF